MVNSDSKQKYQIFEECTAKNAYTKQNIFNHFILRHFNIDIKYLKFNINVIYSCL